MLAHLAFLILAAWLPGEWQPEPMVLQSAAFKHNGTLPRAYTGYGDFKSPPLSWSGVPTATRGFALVVEDADVPLERFSVHWLLYNIPATVTRFGEMPPTKASSEHPSPVKGAAQGVNALKRVGWLPPRPFAGTGVHHYTFTLYALDAELDLPAGATKAQLFAALKGHVIAEAKLVAEFEHKEP
jgi:hypothetical protein